MNPKVDVQALLSEIDDEFSPRLSSRVDLVQYAAKIVNSATVLCIYESGHLSAFAAVYCNDAKGGTAFLTMIAVAKRRRGAGLALSLLRNALQYVRALNFARLKLEVYKNNSRAIEIYRQLGFEIVSETNTSLFMQLEIV